MSKIVHVKQILSINSLTANPLTAKDRLPVSASGFYWEKRFGNNVDWENSCLFPVTIANEGGMSVSVCAVVYGTRPFKLVAKTVLEYPLTEWVKTYTQFTPDGAVAPGSDAFFCNHATVGITTNQVINILKATRKPAVNSYISFITPDAAHQIVGESFELAFAMAMYGGMPWLYSGAVVIPKGQTWTLKDLALKRTSAIMGNSTLCVLSSQVLDESITNDDYHTDYAFETRPRGATAGVVIANSLESLMLYQIGTCFVSQQVVMATQRASAAAPMSTAEVATGVVTAMNNFLATDFPGATANTPNDFFKLLADRFKEVTGKAYARGIKHNDGWDTQSQNILSNIMGNWATSPNKVANLLVSYRDLIAGIVKKTNAYVTPTMGTAGRPTSFVSVPTSASSYSSLFTTKKKSAAKTAQATTYANQAKNFFANVIAPQQDAPVVVTLPTSQVPLEHVVVDGGNSAAAAAQLLSNGTRRTE